MSGLGAHRTAVRALVLLALLWAAPFSQAERLPLRAYTTADGLAQNHVKRIVRDSRGFLWFCTADGLSRFDGRYFVTYGMEHGLSHPNVNDLVEEAPGVYWIATNGGGVCRLFAGRIEAAPEAPAGSRFTTYGVAATPGASWVNVVRKDRGGRLWAGTDGGLYFLDESAVSQGFREVALPAPGPIEALLEDRHGALWIGANGLYRLWPGGRLERYTTRQGLPSDYVKALLEDREGRLWAGTPGGLCLLVSDPQPDRPVVERYYTTKDGLPSNIVTSLAQASGGDVWVGLHGGVGRLGARDQTDRVVASYSTGHGLGDTRVTAIEEDRDGNVWIGTMSRGATKLTSHGFISFTEEDGLGHRWIASIFESRSGQLVVSSGDGGAYVNAFDGERFTATRVGLPRSAGTMGWGWHQIAFEDRAGDWWVPTAQGLCRYAPVARVEQLARASPKAVYTTRDGLKGNNIFRIFEDSRGDIWIGNINEPGGDDGVTRWERATGVFHRYGAADGIPQCAPPTAFCEDGAGNVWMGFYAGGLARYRDGRFTLFNTTDGAPAGQVRALYLDHARRLWIASNQGGLGRVDDPAADCPRFASYTIANGLTSNGVWCVTEDVWGRMYLGTGRGVDVLDPETGQVRHYDDADGLISSIVRIAFRDRHGALWFGTEDGLSRLVPRLEPPRPPPPIAITGVRVQGRPLTLSELGETQLEGLELDPGQHNIEIEFGGLAFAAGERLKYQYKLEGGDREWSAPTDQRTVTFASLAPGSYRFLVRAVSADSDTSPTPASVAFTVALPIWQRWWFLLLVAVVSGLTVFTIHESRLRRLVELERIRTRIATDLHDDIGSNLSQIAILSEVARNQACHGVASGEQELSAIARVARETVDAMGDIVWAINPQRDWLTDLVGRMRRFASDVLCSRDIELRFRADLPDDDVKLGADQRRQIFLIFKECVNNIARHSGCARASVTLRVEGPALVMRLEDDGAGFDPSAVERGHGLASMRRRAESVGGELHVATERGSGTRVTLRAPLVLSSRHWTLHHAKSG